MIPRTLHVIWVGDESRRPDNCINTWRQHNPDWAVRVWGNDDLANYGWVNAAHMREMSKRELNGVADLMRWEILYNEGGFVVDADSICVRPLEPWLFEGEACACWENELVRPGLIAAGYVASVPNNPFIGQMILDLQNTDTVVDRMAWESVGPQFLTDSVQRQGYNGLTIWPSHFFIPKHFTGLEYTGPGQVFATQEWGSTLKGYDKLHEKKLPGVAAPQKPAAKPASADAGQATLLKRAQALLDGKRWQEAADVLREAVARAPEDGGVWLTLARTLRAAHQLTGWLEAAEQALKHAATEAHGRAALLLAAEAAMALNEHDYVVRLATALPEAQRRQEFELLRLQGTALNRLNRPKQAVEVLMQALALKLDDRDAYVELGFAFDNLKMRSEAAECFSTVVALYPDHLGAQSYLLHLKQHTAQWAGYEERIQGLLAAQAQAAKEDGAQFSVPFTLVSLPHQPAQMLEAARMTSRYLCQAVRPLPPMPPRAPRAGRRLHIGLLSNDLQAHATATLITEVIERLDRSRYEISFFSHAVDDGSDYRRRLSAACDHFEDVQPLGLQATAQRIRELGVDLLVDLKGHTSGSRLPVLAYRPAPLQVTWLGFPGTTGLDGVDYIVGDRFVTPLDHQPWYSEQIAQMPHSYQPNDSHRPRGAAPAHAELGLPDSALVLLSANQVYKLNPPLFDAWMEVLRRVPQAVLWQLSGTEDANDALRAEATKRGVSAERLVFMPAVSLQEHALRLGAADLALDSWPCNGHTTTSDALWAGVPVVSLLGDSFAGRVSASLLNAVGLPELVCADAAAYVEKVCALAESPAARAELRDKLLLARDQAPLFDANGFASDLEALFERMWTRHEAGQAPQPLEARPR